MNLVAQGRRSMVYMQRSALLELPGLPRSYVEAGICLLAAAKEGSAGGQRPAAHPAYLSGQPTLFPSPPTFFSARA